MKEGIKIISTKKANDLDNLLMFMELREEFNYDWEVLRDYALERPTKIPHGACKQVNYQGSYWAMQQYSFIPDWS